MLLQSKKNKKISVAARENVDNAMKHFSLPLLGIVVSTLKMTVWLKYIREEGKSNHFFLCAHSLYSASVTELALTVQ